MSNAAKSREEVPLDLKSGRPPRWFGAAALVIALAVASVGAADTDRVIIGVKGDLDSFNIYTAGTFLSQEIADLLFLRLAVEQDDFAEGPPGFTPGLAKAWELSPDGLTLTFRLDETMVWSDGAPITSRDVLFSHHAAVSPEVGWIGRDVKELIASVEAVDDHTVRYRFTRRYPYQLMDAAEGNILPAHHYGKTPMAEWPKTSFTTAPVVSGPYRLKAYRQNERIELERNESYRGRPAGIDRVILRVIPDEATLLAELESGGIDVMENVPAGQMARLQANPRLDVLRVHDLSYTFICWNVRSSLFSDARVRRALTMAIDRRAMVEGLLYGEGLVSSSPILSLFWAHDPGMAPPAYDPDGARRLLEEAGWRDTDADGVLDRDGTPFRFTLESNQGSRLRNDVAVMVQSDLRKIGIAAEPRIVEWRAFLAAHARHEFDAFVAGQREPTKVDLKSLLHTDAIENGFNYGSYSNPELDRILDAARAEPDTTRARALWKQAQEIFLKDQPLTILFEKVRVNAISSRLRGVVMSPRSALAGLPSWRLAPDASRAATP